VNEIAANMMADAISQMRDQGFSEDQIEIGCSGDFRYTGQTFELTLQLSNDPLQIEQAEELSERFTKHYEDTYGIGTAWKGVPITLVNFTVTVTGRQERPSIHGRPQIESERMSIEPSARRSVFLPEIREKQEIAVYSEGDVVPGVYLEGPAIVDAGDTTIFVPSNFHLKRDGLANYILIKS
jgi:N-methylhydantoinase A